METIQDQVFTKLCRVLEKSDKGQKYVTKKELIAMLEKVYQEWEYIIKGY